jgi:hypothetical protein
MLATRFPEAQAKFEQRAQEINDVFSQIEEYEKEIAY